MLSIIINIRISQHNRDNNSTEDFCKNNDIDTDIRQGKHSGLGRSGGNSGEQASNTTYRMLRNTFPS